MPSLITPRTRILHVPKTGGTWVWRALEAAGTPFEAPGGLPPQPRTNHLDLRRTEAYADRFTIAFVRHPLDWWRSLWAYRTRTSWNPSLRVDALAGSDDFTTFIERVITHFPGYLEAHFEPYIGPVSDPIEFVGRFESLADDLVRALRTAGEQFDEAALRGHAPENASDYAVTPALYRPDLAARLAESEAAVIERFYADDPVPAWLVAEPAGRGRRRPWPRLSRHRP